MIGTVTRHNDIGVIYNKAPQDQDYWTLIYTDEGEGISIVYGNAFVASVLNIFSCTEEAEMIEFIEENNIYIDKADRMGDANLEKFFGVIE